jgi:hypothetical protein
MSVVRDAAKDLIRYYVQRGDDIDSFLHGSHMGHYGLDYHAQIGGSVTWNNQRKKIADDRIAVTEIEGVPYFETFSVKQLWKEIQDEMKNKNKPQQLSLF